MQLNDRGRQNGQRLNEALKHLRSTMPTERVSLSDRVGVIHSKYIGTARDDDLEIYIQEMIDNASAALHGISGKRRALFVIGESGSGKSTAIQRCIASHKEFSPYEDGEGRTIHPLVTLEAPGSMTLKVLAIELLRAIGYPVIKKLDEGEAWELLKEQLAFRKVLFLHIDEMQHVMDSNNHATVEKVSNTIKSLLQIPNWPLHVIMSGVPALSKFRENSTQIKTRSEIMEFERITSAKVIARIVKQIIEVHAQLTADEDVLKEEFVARLVHAMDGAFGTCIEFTRTTVIRVLRATAGSDVKATVEPHHFAMVYSSVSGCKSEDNIFTEKNWTSINPSNALKRMQNEFAHKRTARTREKALK